VVEQGILLWRLLHHVILQYRAAHPEWLFVRHEDLSRRPLQTFEQVFAWLGLTLSPDVRQVIETHSGADNPGEAPGNAVHHLRRDSRANIWNWRHRLTPEEVAHPAWHLTSPATSTPTPTG
jgi:hypothetical protein